MAKELCLNNCQQDLPGPVLTIQTLGGIVAPDQVLDVVGTVRIDGDLEFEGAQTISTTAGDLTISPADQVYFTTNVGIGVGDPDELLELYKVGTQLKLSGGAADYATFAVAADGALTITTVDDTAAEGDILLMPDGDVGIGTATPASKLQVAGAISSATLKLSAEGPTDDLDVSGVNAVFVDTSSNNVTLGGTVGGVDGQTLNIAVDDATNNFTIENEEVDFDPTTDMEAWWELNEESGERADSHGSNNLTDNATVLYGTGKQGNAANFEFDTAEYLSIADNASLSVADEDFSIACWVKAESLAEEAHKIITKGTTGGIAGVEYEIDWLQSSNRFRFYVSDGTNIAIAVANNLGNVATGTWYFIVAEHDSVNNLVKITVNNGTVDTAANPAGGAQDLGGAFYIGRQVGTAYYWDGLVDEVGFWKRLLSAHEKAWLYSAGAGRTYAAAAAADAYQPFFLHAEADEVMTAEHGGWIFVNMGGTHWHDCSHAKRV